ncbi:MAG: YgjV family protein [Clostridia bacterium]|nr:YgjV family protein [Clostridia bacterium]
MSEFLATIGNDFISDFSYFLSYILTFSGLICMLASSLFKFKNMKAILLLVFLGNALVATSYLFSKSWNGAISCYIGAIQTIINYFYYSKGEDLPRWLIGVYAIAFIVANLAVYSGWHTFIAIIAALVFILCIAQKKTSHYRLYTLVNLSLWAFYDIVTFSFAQLILHSVQIVTSIVGIVINDIIKKSKQA